MAKPDAIGKAPDEEGEGRDSLVSITRRCVELLDDAVLLTKLVPADRYSETVAEVSPSSVGAHVRHCHDFLEQLVLGLESGTIEYEERTRDPRIETDRDYARAKILTLKDRLCMALDGREGDREVQVRLEYSGRGRSRARSTIARELDVACNHTVHHFGILALMLRAMNLEVPIRFGIAPSTIRYRGDEVG